MPHAKQHSKKLKAVRSKRSRDKARAHNLEGYLARNRKEKAKWQRNNPARVLEIGPEVRTRAIALKKHECKICNRSLLSKTALTRYLASKVYQKQVRLAAGGEPNVVSADAMKSRRFAANKRASQAFYCATCDKTFNRLAHLTQHLKTAKYLRKVTGASA